MTFDIVIVGNGVLACTTALYTSLTDPSLKIGLVGPRSRRGAASAAAGAMLNLFAELEPDTLSTPLHKFKFELGRQSRALWAGHVDLLNEHADGDSLTVRSGTFIVNNTRADALDDAGFNAIVEALTCYREPFEFVDAGAISGYEPIPSRRALKAVHIPGEGFIPSRRLLTTLDAAVRSRSSITRVDAEVVTLASSAGRHEITLSSGERLSAPVVLLANGAAAQQLIDQVPQVGRRMPRLFYGVGCGLVLRPPSMLTEVVRTPNRGLACGLHTVPDIDSGTCYVGASNFISQVPEYHVRASSMEVLLRAAREEINSTWYKATLEEVRVGHRPTSADLFPLIGQTSIDGLWVLSGTKRDGLFMSPLYGREMAAALLSGRVCFDNRFAPERALITTMSREEGIRKAVAHLWSGAYQHDLQLPHAGWEPHVEAMLQRRVLDAYEQGGNPDYGIPPELLDMYRYKHIQPTDVRS